MELRYQCDSFKLNLEISEGATWHEALNIFVNFLQGCGYIFDGYEAGQYLSSEYAFQKVEEVPVCELEHEYKPKKKRRKKCHTSTKSKK